MTLTKVLTAKFEKSRFLRIFTFFVVNPYFSRNEMDEIPKNALKAYGSLFDNGKKLVLPISKEFFDKILEKSKKTEFRKSVNFYHRLFREKALIKTLYLHYRKGIVMRCDVLSVDHYERPEHLAQSKFITTDFCYGINVENPQIVEIHEI